MYDNVTWARMEERMMQAWWARNAEEVRRKFLWLVRRIIPQAAPRRAELVTMPVRPIVSYGART